MNVSSKKLISLLLLTVPGLMAFTFNVGTFWKAAGGSGGGCDPSSVPNLELWYDARDMSTLFQDELGTSPVTANGQNVSLIKNKVDLSQGCVADVGTLSAPTYQASGINGYPALNFSSSHACRAQSISEFISANQFTMFLVTVADSATGTSNFAPQNNNGIVSLESDNSLGYSAKSGGTIQVFEEGSMSSLGIAFGTGALIKARLKTSGMFRFEAEQDNYSFMSGSGGSNVSPVTSKLVLGTNAASSMHFDGRIGALLVYNRALSNAEVSSVSACLTAGFGI